MYIFWVCDYIKNTPFGAEKYTKMYGISSLSRLHFSHDGLANIDRKGGKHQVGTDEYFVVRLELPVNQKHDALEKFGPLNRAP